MFIVEQGLGRPFLKVSVAGAPRASTESRGPYPTMAAMNVIHIYWPGIQQFTKNVSMVPTLWSFQTSQGDEC